jgi:di/tripeptidase
VYLFNDYEFNWCIVVDVMYLDSKPVLHVVDVATAFQAAKFLKDMSAKTTWDTLRICWIDVYQGPPDIIISDAGKNFASEEFRQHAATMDIDIKEIPVEAHNSVGKVERYHGPLRRAYEILSNELPSLSTNKEVILQMAVKAVNDSAGPDGIHQQFRETGATATTQRGDPFCVAQSSLDCCATSRYL